MNRCNRLILAVLASLIFYPLCLQGLGTFEIRGSAFFPAKEQFRKAYGDVNGTYGVEADIDLPCDNHLWLNFDQFSKHGNAHGSRHSQMCLSTFSIGLKRFASLNCWSSAYLGLGVSLSSVYFKHCFDDCRKTDRRGSIGVVAKSGVIVDLWCDFFLDVFADYYYQPVSYRHRTTNVGGLRTGAGIGYRF